MLATLQDLSFLELFGIAAAYIFLRGFIFCTGFYFLYQKLAHSYGIVQGDYAKGQLRSEIIANIKVNLVDSIVLPSVIALGLVKAHEFSWTRFAGTFLFGYLFFELWFYGVHRWFHVTRFRSIHRQHHLSRITSAFSALSLSPLEKLFNVTGLFVIPCLLTHFIPLVLEGILAYHFYNFFVNVLGHSNLEFFWKGYERTFPGKILATSTYHSIHHTQGNRNFGLFTSIPDRLFGTYEKNYTL